MEAIKEDPNKKEAFKNGPDKRVSSDKESKVMSVSTTLEKTDPKLFRSSVMLRMHVTWVTARKEPGLVEA